MPSGIGLAVAPRPSSGPQPPLGQPFFFNPENTNDTSVCSFSIPTAENDEAVLDANVTALPRATGEKCCSGVGLWQDVLLACRTESNNATKTYEACVNNTGVGCTWFKGYRANVEWLFWGNVEWPAPFDNSTHWITTAFGAHNTAGNETAASSTRNSTDNSTGTAGDSTAERCCAHAKGTYAATLSNSKQKHQKRYHEGFGEWNRTMFPPCLIPKEQADAYKQCVLDAAPNALVMAESWQYNKTAQEGISNRPHNSAGPARKLGVGFALLAASAAILTLA